MSWDFIIIGSGFGGSVTACRLAQNGQKVLVLERGHAFWFQRRAELSSRIGGVSPGLLGQARPD